MLIGLTGGIASGKSTVSALFVKHGALLVDADQVAREVVEPGEKALLQIVEQFGEQILQADGRLNRAALGAIVFSNSDKLKQLECITHPAIRARMLERIERYKQEQPDALIVADIPLLYETKQDHLYDTVVVVYTPQRLQIERLIVRNQISEQEAITRIKLQMDIEEKRMLADWIIDNSKSLQYTEQQVIELISKLRDR